MAKTHYKKGKKSLCGLSKSNLSEDRDEVTCKRCLSSLGDKIKYIVFTSKKSKMVPKTDSKGKLRVFDTFTEARLSAHLLDVVATIDMSNIDYYKELV